MLCLSPGGSSRAKVPSPRSSAKACPCASGGCAGRRPRGPYSSCADEGSQTEVTTFMFVCPSQHFTLPRRTHCQDLAPTTLPVATPAALLTCCAVAAHKALALPFHPPSLSQEGIPSTPESSCHLHSHQKAIEHLLWMLEIQRRARGRQDTRSSCLQGGAV